MVRLDTDYVSAEEVRRQNGRTSAKWLCVGKMVVRRQYGRASAKWSCVGKVVVRRQSGRASAK